jgi:Ran GTPase-activating protein (RanGAP) involved in mRNA processing and transport
MSLDASEENIGPAGVQLIAEALRTSVTGSLTALDLSSNRLKDEGVSAVCENIQSNKESKLASLNFRSNGIGPGGANAVAAMVAVTGALTSLDLSNNFLCGVTTYGGGALGGTYTAEGITAIAEALRVNGALTSINLRGNKLWDEGWGAIFAAICGNMDSKILSMDASYESIGPAGVKLIAEALRTSVTGALTEVYAELSCALPQPRCALSCADFWRSLMRR